MWLESTGRLSLGSPAVAPTARLDIVNPTAADVVLKVTGASGQTGRLMQFRTSTGTELLYLTNGGLMNLAGRETINSTNAQFESLLINSVTGDAGASHGSQSGETDAMALWHTADNVGGGYVRGLYINSNLSNVEAGIVSGIQVDINMASKIGPYQSTLAALSFQAGIVGSGQPPSQASAIQGVLVWGTPISQLVTDHYRGIELFLITQQTSGNFNRYSQIRNRMQIKNTCAILDDISIGIPAIVAPWGVITGMYRAIHIEDVAGAGGAGDTVSWVLYCEGGKSVHVGKFGFGSLTAPSHRLDIAAGTSTIAPIRLASATPVTAPVVGCVEFDTDDWLVTITTGAERKSLVYADSASAPVERPFATGTFTVETGRGALVIKRMVLTGTQRATVQGTSRLSVR